MRFHICLLIVCSAVYGANSNDKAEPTFHTLNVPISDDAPTDTGIARAGRVKRDLERQGKFLVKFSHTSVTRLITVTKNVLTTCYSTNTDAASAPGPCNGKRRKKRSFELTDFEATNEERPSETDLDSSVPTQNVAHPKSARTGKKLTFWSTSFSTLTVTTKSFIMGTTVTVTALCTIPGVLDSAFCGFVHFD